jgi:hypothetical protein
MPGFGDLCATLPGVGLFEPSGFVDKLSANFRIMTARRMFVMRDGIEMTIENDW